MDIISRVSVLLTFISIIILYPNLKTVVRRDIIPNSFTKYWLHLHEKYHGTSYYFISLRYGADQTGENEAPWEIFTSHLLPSGHKISLLFWRSGPDENMIDRMKWICRIMRTITIEVLWDIDIENCIRICTRHLLRYQNLIWYRLIESFRKLICI